MTCKMLGVTLWLLGVFACASCAITCPDGSTCSDFATCCRSKHGYNCCQYPNAVCCSDLAHCCPPGFHCNTTRQMCERKPGMMMMMMPTVKKPAAEEQPVSRLQEPVKSQVADPKKSAVVQCDYYYTCPDATTCCKHPTGVWFCCPYTHGRCCLDGYHCCPYGFECDLTYTHCVKQGLRYPFSPYKSVSSVPASLVLPPEEKTSLQETPMTALTDANGAVAANGVIRCDSSFYCATGTTCCKGPTGQWNCCPYSLGQYCADGQHCCEYGYTCDSTSLLCKSGYSEIPSGTQEAAKTD